MVYSSQFQEGSDKHKLTTGTTILNIKIDSYMTFHFSNSGHSNTSLTFSFVPAGFDMDYIYTNKREVC